jgi:hypothetical protein
LIGSRSTAVIVLALSAASGVAVTAAGCGGPTVASARQPAAKAGKAPKTSAPAPASLITCLNSHGVSIPAGAGNKQVKSAFKTLPAAQQQSAYTACGSLLPAKLRQKIQARLTAPSAP